MMSTQQRQQPELTKDQLTQLDSQLKSQGKDTSNLDKIISNFSSLDSNGDGKVSMSELQAGASQDGISMPKGGGHHHHGHHGGPPPSADGDSSSTSSAQQSWGPPPGLLSSDGTSSSSGDSSSNGSASNFDPNTFMLNMLAQFAGSDPTSSTSSTDAASSSVNIAA